MAIGLGPKPKGATGEIAKDTGGRSNLKIPSWLQAQA